MRSQPGAWRSSGDQGAGAGARPMGSSGQEVGKGDVRTVVSALGGNSSHHLSSHGDTGVGVGVQVSLRLAV